MQDNICQVMSAGCPAKKLNVQRVRYPCQRMPVAGIEVLKGPLCGLFVHTSVDVRVVDHVHVIVGVDERIGGDRPVQSQRDRSQQKADYVRASDLRHRSRIGGTEAGVKRKA